jgi:pimeloyl-ACP methyl ester carboxylesterase
MSTPERRDLSDGILGCARLIGDGVEPLTDLVEDVHQRVSRPLRASGQGGSRRTRGITGFVYRTVRRVTRGVRSLLGRQARPVPLQASRHERRSAAWKAALNGVLGHHLADTGNALAIPMVMRREGLELPLQRDALATAVPDPSGSVLVLVHGLCMNDLQWNWRGAHHGEALGRELGYTPVYLHYNTGLHISTNGRAFAALLERLHAEWPVPVEQVAIVGHSMGGMVTRSACHYAAEAGLAWLPRLRKLVFLATPHHGAPLERGGNRFETALAATPYAAPFSRLGRMRSAGITDLRYGNLLDDDWQGRDRFEPGADQRRVVPLPSGVECFAIAATQGRRTSDLRDRLLGDGLVRLDSALGEHRDPARVLPFGPDRRRIVYRTSHFELLRHPEAYALMREWLEA